jgi:hypothetical protein
MTTGTVMVFVSPEGRVIAHAACFERGGPAGFTAEQYQSSLCERALDAAVVEALCHPVMLEATDVYARGRITAELVQKKGYQRHTITVEVPAS